MPKESNIVNCPQCGAEINVSELLYQQVEEQLQKDFATETARRQRDFDKRVKELEEDKATLAKQIESVRGLPPGCCANAQLANLSGIGHLGEDHRHVARSGGSDEQRDAAGRGVTATADQRCDVLSPDDDVPFILMRVT